MTACLMALSLLACPVAAATPDPVLAGPPAEAWVGEDKVRHLALSFGATGLAFGTARIALEPAPAAGVAAGSVLAAGLIKESTDARAGGAFGWKDLLWNAVGVALGYTFVQQIE